LAVRNSNVGCISFEQTRSPSGALRRGSARPAAPTACQLQERIAPPLWREARMVRACRSNLSRLLELVNALVAGLGRCCNGWVFYLRLVYWRMSYPAACVGHRWPRCGRWDRCPLTVASALILRSSSGTARVPPSKNMARVGSGQTRIRIPPQASHPTAFFATCHTDPTPRSTTAPQHINRPHTLPHNA
jgi:hypothetical protein